MFAKEHEGALYNIDVGEGESSCCKQGDLTTGLQLSVSPACGLSSLNTSFPHPERLAESGDFLGSICSVLCRQNVFTQLDQ